MVDARSITSNIIVYAHPVSNSAHFYDYYSSMNVKPSNYDHSEFGDSWRLEAPLSHFDLFDIPL